MVSMNINASPPHDCYFPASFPTSPAFALPVSTIVPFISQEPTLPICLLLTVTHVPVGLFLT